MLTRLALCAGCMLSLLGWSMAQETAPAEAASAAAAQSDEIALESLPSSLLRVLKRSDAWIEQAQKDATRDIEAYLNAEVQGDYAHAFSLIYSGTKNRFSLDQTNQAIISDIELFLNPPEEPTVLQREAIQRVKTLAESGQISLDVQEPLLWAFEWTHATGSIDPVFNAIGPYANHFRLLNYSISNVQMASREIAAAWVSEDIAVPVGIRLKRLSVFLLKPEEGQWRIYAHRAVDGPRIYSWLGMKTTLWPDELQLADETSE